MCDPVSITLAAASIATTAVSAFTGVAAQNRNADNQNQYQQQLLVDRNTQQTRVNEAATAAYTDRTYQEDVRQQQEQIAGKTNEFQSNIQGAQAVARARVSAGESGVAGLSVDNLLNDYYRQQGNYNSATEQNLGFSAQQSYFNKLGIKADAQSQVNSVAPFRPQQAFGGSYLGAAVQTIGAAAGTINNARVKNPPGQPR